METEAGLQEAPRHALRDAARALEDLLKIHPYFVSRSRDFMVGY